MVKKRILLILLGIIILFLLGYLLNQYNNSQVNTGDIEKISQLEQQLSGLLEQFSGLQTENLELKEILSGSLTSIQVLQEENEALINELNIIKGNENNKDTITTKNNTGNVTYNGDNISSKASSTNKITTLNYGYGSEVDGICNWHTDDYLPNATRVADVKFINTKLQDVRDNGQHLVAKHVKEAYDKLNAPGLTNKDRCRYSWLIDALENQKGILKSYKTENGITTIGIDFISYQDDVSKIALGHLGGYYDGGNTSSKIRYYKLSSNPQLQTLTGDSLGYTSLYAYLNNFEQWLNEFCNNQPIFNGDKKHNINSNELEELDWNNYGKKNAYCVKNRLKEEYNILNLYNILNFQFNSNGELQKIDLNRRQLGGVV